jgi:BlaI family penicillinase repressor
MQKGAVRSEREDGRQRYHAVLEREVWLDGEVGALVDRLFDGDFEALVAHVRRSNRPT